MGLTEGEAGVVRGTVLSNTAPGPDYLLLAATPRRSLAPAGRTPAAVPHAGSPPRLRTLPVPRNLVNNHRCLKLPSTMMLVYVDETFESHTY